MEKQNENLNWIAETIQNYTEQLSLTKAETTISAYRSDLDKFFAYVESKGVKKFKNLKPDHILGYLGKCKKEGKSDSTLNRYYMAIKSFCKFLRRSRMIEEDLTLDISAPRNVQKAPKILSKDEIVLILQQPNTNTFSGLRDRAILELLYSSGLRASELCDLELEDVTETSVRISCGKGSKTRTIPITESAGLWISAYIEQYRGKESGYLFLTQNFKRLRRQLLFDIVVTYAKKASVEGVTPHSLRHACATHLLGEGADLMLVKEILGHSSVAMTQRYIHLTSKKIEDMFKQYHPRQE